MEIISRKTAYDGHFKVSLLTIQDGDEQLKRERFEPGTAVAALVWDTQQERYLLTRQYRVGAEAEVLEIAAGMVDGDETPETAIRREVQEELGYDVDRLEQIARIYPSPGANAEVITIFFAEVSNKSGEGGGLVEESEKIESVVLTHEQLVAQQYEDAKTLIAVQWAQLRK
ncbi:NUDIX hydrolase [Hymenobacter tibetensis]|uniref:GDP-mannose pyrophosphatase n=1 Tax=Hymenobacter tibetensis TaxID=497967 RepID=A0ABY4CRX5_9BACT|nr:NUDIX hydrolase [Hymenobacter tibetensis]UOG72973.1 NUDIX hydrolase [Hymenobacter tibetensis]